MEALSGISQLWYALFSLAQFWLAPFITLAVSIAYFRASPSTQRLAARLAASSHGASITVLYLGAMAVWLSGHSNSAYAGPFAFFLLIPLVLVVVAFFVFRGRKMIHLLQFINVAALAWTFFIGSMAVTDRWL